MEKFAGCRGITGRICETRFKNLKRKYPSLKTTSQQTGRQGPTTWPYYDLFDDLLRNDRAINPNNILEVGAGWNRIRRREVKKIFYSLFSSNIMFVFNLNRTMGTIAMMNNQLRDESVYQMPKQCK
jgi:hypothetical protein